MTKNRDTITHHFAVAITHAAADGQCGRPWQCACSHCRYARDFAPRWLALNNLPHDPKKTFYEGKE